MYAVLHDGQLYFRVVLTEQIPESWGSVSSGDYFYVYYSNTLPVSNTDGTAITLYYTNYLYLENERVALYEQNTLADLSSLLGTYTYVWLYRDDGTGNFYGLNAAAEALSGIGCELTNNYIYSRVYTVAANGQYKRDRYLTTQKSFYASAHIAAKELTIGLAKTHNLDGSIQAINAQGSVEVIGASSLDQSGYRDQYIVIAFVNDVNNIVLFLGHDLSYNDITIFVEFTYNTVANTLTLLNYTNTTGVSVYNRNLFLSSDQQVVYLNGNQIVKYVPDYLTNTNSISTITNTNLVDDDRNVLQYLWLNTRMVFIAATLETPYGLVKEDTATEVSQFYIYCLYYSSYQYSLTFILDSGSGYSFGTFYDFDPTVVRTTLYVPIDIDFGSIVFKDTIQIPCKELYLTEPNLTVYVPDYENIMTIDGEPGTLQFSYKINFHRAFATIKYAEDLTYGKVSVDTTQPITDAFIDDNYGGSFDTTNLNYLQFGSTHTSAGNFFNYPSSNNYVLRMSYYNLDHKYNTGDWIDEFLGRFYIANSIDTTSELLTDIPIQLHTLETNANGNVDLVSTEYMLQNNLSYVTRTRLDGRTEHQNLFTLVIKPEDAFIKGLNWDVLPKLSYLQSTTETDALNITTSMDTNRDITKLIENDYRYFRYFVNNKFDQLFTKFYGYNAYGEYTNVVTDDINLHRGYFTPYVEQRGYRDNFGLDVYYYDEIIITAKSYLDFIYSGAYVDMTYEKLKDVLQQLLIGVTTTATTATYHCFICITFSDLIYTTQLQSTELFTSDYITIICDMINSLTDLTSVSCNLKLAFLLKTKEIV